MINSIFFSYSRIDNDVAIQLANDLLANGVNIWMDQLNIKPAEQWDLAIQNALKNAGCILFLVSQNSVNSQNVMDEINYAIDKKKQVIPLILESVELPLRVSRLQWIDFRSNYELALKNLIEAISSNDKQKNVPNPDITPVIKHIRGNSSLIKYISDKPGAISKATGILLLLLAAFITLVNKCPSNGQMLTIYILFGAGLALLFAESAKNTIFKFSLYNFGVTLIGGLGVPFILSIVDPIGSYKADDCRINPFTTITVSVHGKKGINDLVLKGKGKVVMNIPKEIKKQPINDEGQASFPNIRVGDSVRLDIEFSEPYHPEFPDSNYKIYPNDIIYLRVVLEGLDKIYGKVLSGDSSLSGVTIQVEGPVDTLKTVSNQNGFYTIYIPEALQKHEYNVWFSKTGFKTKSVKCYPQVGAPMNILMEPVLKRKKNIRR